MTETTTVATSPLPDLHKPGSVGVLIANTEAMVSYVVRYLFFVLIHFFNNLMNDISS